MTLPRALSGPIYSMARPARPSAEAHAVQAAAARLRAEAGVAAAQPLARAIAAEVIDRLLSDAMADPDGARLASITGDDPICKLAFAPDIGAVDELAARFRDTMLAQFGAYIPPIFQQEALRRRRTQELEATLVERYARHLRNISLTVA